MSKTIERKTCRAADGVRLVYSVSGNREPALVFIHGGFAERSFWDAEFGAFSESHRVIALDLPGHGESGSDRLGWSLPAYGADVKAVVTAENVKSCILFGNSLGGPVAVEAALLLHECVLGVVGVDTFHRADYRYSEEEARQRAEAFRDSYSASVHEMLLDLFHRDVDPAILDNAERRMQQTPPAVAYDMFLGMAGYDLAAAVRALRAPLRAINGDLYPTDVAAVRQIKPDFEVRVMEHTGHYPMLERPDEFNRHIAEVVATLGPPVS